MVVVIVAVVVVALAVAGQLANSLLANVTLSKDSSICIYTLVDRKR